MARRLRRAKAEWIGCCHVTLQETKWLAQRHSLNLNFSVLNRISVLLISSSYSIVLKRLSGPRSQIHGRIKVPGIEPGPPAWKTTQCLRTIRILFENCVLHMCMHIMSAWIEIGLYKKLSILRRNYGRVNTLMLALDCFCSRLLTKFTDILIIKWKCWWKS